MVHDEEWGDADDYVADEWMTLLEAVEAIAERAGLGYVDAKANILELIADSRLHLRCERARIEADIGRVAWTRSSKIKSHPRHAERGHVMGGSYLDEPVELSMDFFGRRSEWVIDAERVDWEAGTIVSTRPAKLKLGKPVAEEVPATRHAATGVLVWRKETFFSPQSDRIDSLSLNSDSLPENKIKSKTGKMPGRERHPSWYDWIAEIAILARLDDIDPEMKSEDFHDIIKSRLDYRKVECPEFTTVHKAIPVIQTRWREAKNSRELPASE